MKKTLLHGTTMAKMVERLMRPEPGPRAVHRHLAGAALAVLNLEKMAANLNPMETDAAHARRVAAAAGQLKTKITKLENELAEETTRQRDRLHREIKEKSRLVPSQHAAEIRASLRAMPGKDRTEAMINALRGSDTGAEILAAVADGNLITTGLDDTTRTRFIQDFQQRQAPDEFAELSALDELLEHAPQIMELAKQAVNEAVDEKYIERINEAEKAARDAADNFNQSVA